MEKEIIKKIPFTPEGYTRDINDIARTLKSLPPGKEYNIYILEAKQVRTLEHNKYYWLLLKAIAEHTGNNIHTLHEEFKKRYNPEILLKNGEPELIAGSTKAMKKAQFASYIEEIIAEVLYDYPDFEIPDRNRVPDEVYLDLINKGVIKV